MATARQSRAGYSSWRGSHNAMAGIWILRYPFERTALSAGGTEAPPDLCRLQIQEEHYIFALGADWSLAISILLNVLDMERQWESGRLLLCRVPVSVPTHHDNFGRLLKVRRRRAEAPCALPNRARIAINWTSPNNNNDYSNSNNNNSVQPAIWLMR